MTTRRLENIFDIGEGRGSAPWELGCTVRNNGDMIRVTILTNINDTRIEFLRGG